MTFEVAGAGFGVASASVVVLSDTSEADVGLEAIPGISVMVAVDGAAGVEFVIPGISFIELDDAAAEFETITGMSFMLFELDCAGIDSDFIPGISFIPFMPCIPFISLSEDEADGAEFVREALSIKEGNARDGLSAPFGFAGSR